MQKFYKNRFVLIINAHFLCLFILLLTPLGQKPSHAAEDDGFFDNGDFEDASHFDQEIGFADMEDEFKEPAPQSSASSQKKSSQNRSDTKSTEKSKSEKAPIAANPPSTESADVSSNNTSQMLQEIERETELQAERDIIAPNGSEPSDSIAEPQSSSADDADDFMNFDDLEVQTPATQSQQKAEEDKIYTDSGDDASEIIENDPDDDLGEIEVTKEEAIPSLQDNTKAKICTNNNKFNELIANLACIYMNHDHNDKDLHCSVQVMESSNQCKEALNSGICDFGIIEENIMSDKGAEDHATPLLQLYHQKLAIIAHEDSSYKSLKDMLNAKIIMPAKNSSGYLMMHSLIPSRKTLAKMEETGVFQSYRSLDKLCNKSNIDGVAILSQHPNPELYEYSKKCNLRLIPVFPESSQYQPDVIPGGTYMGNNDNIPTLSVITSLFAGRHVNKNLANALKHSIINHPSIRKSHPALENIDRAQDQSLDQ